MLILYSTIIEDQFFKTIFEFIIVRIFDRVDSCIDKRFYLLKSGDDIGLEGIIDTFPFDTTHDGISDLDISDGFPPRDYITDLTCGESSILMIVRRKIPELRGIDNRL